MKNKRSIPTAFQVATRRVRSRASECTDGYMSSETSTQQSRSLKGEGYIIRPLQRIKAKVNRFPSDSFWEFMQKSPLKGIYLPLSRHKDTPRNIVL